MSARWGGEGEGEGKGEGEGQNTTEGAVQMVCKYVCMYVCMYACYVCKPNEREWRHWMYKPSVTCKLAALHHQYVKAKAALKPAACHKPVQCSA